MRELVTQLYMEWVGPSIEIVKLVGGRFVRYLKYQIKYNDILQKFEQSKQGLCSRRDEIQSKRETQLQSAPYTVVRAEVEDWLKEVEEFIRKQNVVDEVNSWGYLSCCCRAVILEERSQELKEIYDRGDNYTRDCLVIVDPSASVVPTELQGGEDVKANMLACLKGEEVTMLGVWGMGGVGKTTIMKHVHNDLLKERKFKKVIWVTVSQNFDIYNLQEQIASSLEENLQQNQNTINRAAKLSKMLEEHKPYLLILDDVWSSFKLEDVGIPKPNETNGCKLILTTRSLEVVHSMGCREIKVEILPQKEALKLFLNKVGDAVLSDHGGGIKKDLELTLNKIVDECDGLPLALITVASSLKGISDSWLWSVALNQLRDCKRNVAGDDDVDAFRILKFSYERLKEQQIQYCFLYCALYPENWRIPKEEIIEYWIDEGFIDEMESRHAMKVRGYVILRKLEDNSLLDFIEDEDEGDCVRMNDLIRDMALHITRTSPRFLVEAGKSLKELPERVNCAEGVEKVSLMHNYIEEIPSSMVPSTCTTLTTLLLAHNSLSTIPESIFEHMPELKNLNLSFNRKLRSLPNSISKLGKLTTLLLESTSLEKVPSLSGLGFLKKLNLRGSKMKEVPEGLGMLKNLKCLFLCGSNYGSILEIDEIADGVLSNLSKLEELIVDWSTIELKGDVVGRLKKLEVFHGRFPTMNDMRIFLKSQPQLNRLTRYAITVGSNFDQDHLDEIDGRPKPLDGLSRYKKIMVFKETNIVGENALLPSVQVLFIEACHDIRSLNDFSAIEDATDLRRCLIWDCDGLECILSSWINNPVVQTLEYLDLYSLHKLDGLFEADVIASSASQPRMFSSLKEVVISDCEKIKKLFPSWKFVECFQRLERIEVYNCEEMEEIIGLDPEEEGEGGGGLFSSLKEVVISDCEKIKKLFPSWKFVECFQSLERIKVYHCEELEEIIGSDPKEGGEGGGDIIKRLILPKLKELELKRLPALKTICSKRAVMVCDALESITISDCKGLRRIPLHRPPYLSYLYHSKVENLDGLFEHIQIPQCYRLDNLDAFFEVKGISKSLPPPGICSSVKTISIGYSYKIKKLFPSWMLQGNLQSLEEIDVRHCTQLEEIVSLDPEGEKEGVINLTLPKLKRLRLIYLPKLKRICSSRAVMVCDSLEHVEILQCFHLENLDALFKEEVNSLTLKIIWINGCGKIKKLIPFMWSLQSLEEINVGCCEQMEELVEKEVGRDLGLPKLRRLRLECLPALEIHSITAEMVCASLEEIQILACQRLRWIPLYHLDDLDAPFKAKAFSKSPQPPATCSSLKTISIIGCGKIKRLLLSRFLLGSLPSLEEIIVCDCEQMEAIIALDPEEEEEEKGEVVKLILPKLKKLHLELLPALKSICSTRVKVVFDSLEHIQILQCHHLDNLDDLFEVEGNSMSSPPPGICSSLKTIQIYECSKIKKLFSSRLSMGNFQSLEEINVRYCEQMEGLVASDPEGGELVMDLILPKLKLLKLEGLPALKST